MEWFNREGDDNVGCDGLDILHMNMYLNRRLIVRTKA